MVDKVTVVADGVAFLRICGAVCKDQRGNGWTAYLFGWEGRVGLRVGRNDMRIPAEVSRPFSATLNVGTIRSLVRAKDPTLCCRLEIEGVRATFGLTDKVSFEVRALDLDPDIERRDKKRIDQQRQADACLNRETWASKVTKGLHGSDVPKAVECIEAATASLSWLGVTRDEIVNLVARVRRSENRASTPPLPFPPRDLK